ncbi:MAG: transposase [Verrucomicrobia bacterium]|nr:transposase [Verrucomicrobiota bacterium]
MARLLRVQFEGAIYHVTLRGVERRNIFDNDRERERFLDRLAQDVETHGVRVYLYCLMANHVHLVLETPKANLSRFMHDLQTAYTVFYNRRHQRAGHLMQGRFGAQLVEGDEYLLKLSRYVHLNPVHVGSARALGLKERIAALRAYRWSSYRGYVGLGRPLEWMSETPDDARQGVPQAPGIPHVRGGGPGGDGQCVSERAEGLPPGPRRGGVS